MDGRANKMKVIYVSQSTPLRGFVKGARLLQYRLVPPHTVFAFTTYMKLLSLDLMMFNTYVYKDIKSVYSML